MYSEANYAKWYHPPAAAMSQEENVLRQVRHPPKRDS
jgi:hypothetical protein